ncbi:MAG TPA: DUF3881 family protein [Blastocatellia bacterium]|nr:DUF3881 family protein [Blastocatellia bacterium]
MGEPFDAIGFRISDEPAFQALAEQAHQHGAGSRALRDHSTLHGYCWNLGDGLEVWTILHESKEGLFYADCRPGFRARHTYRLHPWEITEYEEEGEAIVRGLVEGTEVELTFELQNLTEMTLEMFRERVLTVAVAGLAYHVRVSTRPGENQFIPLEKAAPRRHAAENDFAARGQVLDWREISNPRTQTHLVWLYAEFGRIRLELLVNRADLRGELSRGAWFSAELWLQGHVLTAKEVQSRYEGVDAEFPPGDYWVIFRREN